MLRMNKKKGATRKIKWFRWANGNYVVDHSYISLKWVFYNGFCRTKQSGQLFSVGQCRRNALVSRESAMINPVWPCFCFSSPFPLYCVSSDAIQCWNVWPFLWTTLSTYTADCNKKRYNPQNESRNFRIKCSLVTCLASRSCIFICVCCASKGTTNTIICYSLSKM